MPGEIELGKHVVGNFLQAELRADFLQHLAVEHVELGEGTAAGADLLHRRLIEVAPGVGEFEPVGFDAAGCEQAFRFAGDASAPIHHRAEDVVEEGLGHDLLSGVCH